MHTLVTFVHSVRQDEAKGTEIEKEVKLPLFSSAMIVLVTLLILEYNIQYLQFKGEV